MTIDSSQAVTTHAGRYTNKTRITAATYTTLATDHQIFLNTDTNVIACALMAGIDEQYYRICNTGDSGNAVTITPNGAEDLLGDNDSWTLYDGETLILVYDTTDGWY